MKVLIVGTGRVASLMGESLIEADQKVVGVVGRSPLKSTTLAKRFGTEAYAIDSKLPDCDIIIVAVSDDAIEAVSAQLSPGEFTIVHTSGTSAISKLSGHQNCAVLWPIQSITDTTENLQGVPLIIEASSKSALANVAELASHLSNRVVEVSLEKRKRLHMAAVIMSNFPVHLMAEAGRLLEDHGLEPDLLLPLWNGMATRVSAKGNNAALTGPARRGDTGTIDKHLELLDADSELKDIYSSLSKSILKKFHG